MVGSFINNDLDTFFVSSDFGETISYQGSDVQVIFDDEDVEVQLGEGVTEIVAQAMLTGREPDFTGIVDGHTVVVRGVTYRVKNWKRDGTGQIEIYLERV